MGPGPVVMADPLGPFELSLSAPRSLRAGQKVMFPQKPISALKRYSILGEAL